MYNENTVLLARNYNYMYLQSNETQSQFCTLQTMGPLTDSMPEFFPEVSLLTQ